MFLKSSFGHILFPRPPKKSWKNISNLSGGEKTLSSLALVFALHYYKPTPLYVMDEIDAALDFKNVSIVANYVKERTKNAQFIIISLRWAWPLLGNLPFLRSNMFELADRLVGIYKTHDCTKSVTINPGLVEALPPAPRMVAVSPGKVAPRDVFDKVCRVLVVIVDRGAPVGTSTDVFPQVASTQARSSSQGPTQAKRPRPPLGEQPEEQMEV